MNTDHGTPVTKYYPHLGSAKYYNEFTVEQLMWIALHGPECKECSSHPWGAHNQEIDDPVEFERDSIERLYPKFFNRIVPKLRPQPVANPLVFVNDGDVFRNHLEIRRRSGDLCPWSYCKYTEKKEGHVCAPAVRITQACKFVNPENMMWKFTYYKYDVSHSSTQCHTQNVWKVARVVKLV